MAVQLHVAHSKTIKGVGSVAGGIWDCSKGDENRATRICMRNPDKIIPQEQIQSARDLSRAGEIDDVANLHSARLAIFTSDGDLVVKAVAGDKLENFYSAFLPKTSITRLSHSTAAHGFPTLNYGNICTKHGVPWILDCGEDGAGKILAAVEPVLPQLQSRGTQDLLSLHYFDQTTFAKPEAAMFGWGAVYIPKTCRTSNPQLKCGIHIALHGCQMTPDFINSKFFEHAGYNEWAETNQLIILYPQADKSTANPMGCWDWVGYTGPTYMTKTAPQIEAIYAMLKALGI